MKIQVRYRYGEKSPTKNSRSEGQAAPWFPPTSRPYYPANSMDLKTVLCSVASFFSAASHAVSSHSHLCNALLQPTSKTQSDCGICQEAVSRNEFPMRHTSNVTRLELVRNGYVFV